MFHSSGNFQQLQDRLNRLQELPKRARPWAGRNAERIKETYGEKLETQGRGDGTTPLSEFTKKIYREQGGPTGKLADSVEITVSHHGTTTSAIAGLKGEAGIIGLVQEFGTTIQVTPETQDYFAGMNQPLRPDTRYLVIPGRHAMQRAFLEVEKMAIAELRELL